MPEPNGEKLLMITPLFAKTRRKKKRPARNRSKAMTQLNRAMEEHRRFGSLGAASSVRKIDPATGKVVAIIPAE